MCIISLLFLYRVSYRRWSPNQVAGIMLYASFSAIIHCGVPFFSDCRTHLTVRIKPCCQVCAFSSAISVCEPIAHFLFCKVFIQLLFGYIYSAIIPLIERIGKDFHIIAVTLFTKLYFFDPKIKIAQMRLSKLPSGVRIFLCKRILRFLFSLFFILFFILFFGFRNFISQVHRLCVLLFNRFRSADCINRLASL